MDGDRGRWGAAGDHRRQWEAARGIWVIRGGGGWRKAPRSGFGRGKGNQRCGKYSPPAAAKGGETLRGEGRRKAALVLHRKRETLRTPSLLSFLEAKLDVKIVAIQI